MCSLWRTNKETAEIYERNVAMVYRVCFLFFRGHLTDVEDAVQTTFLKLMKDPKPFHDLEHEKAWLIVTASNICKNALASRWNKHVDMDEQSVQQLTIPFRIDETLQDVMTLPNKYKTAIYMFYYEGYSAKEIGDYMGKTESSVWGYLHQGRKRLKQTIKEEN